MEPLDPAKDDESSGFSKRRISSILKAPRKSIRFPDPEQEEYTVECAKPVEKRISRRVSFAPANDVLLFSKDAKNASPARSPLQEFGEKTVMFSTDDAFMDMTHSHTINIAHDADISLQNYDVLPTNREKTVMFTVDDGSMDMTLSHTVNITNGPVSLPRSRNMDLGVEKRNVSPFDHGFENVFGSLSKPNGPRNNPVITRMMPPAGASSEGTNSSLAHIKTQRSDVDKENQAPTSVSVVMEKSINASRKIGELSFGSALCPEDDVSMDMTEVQTGCIQGFTDDDDPFQCLFPTKEMYSHLDNRVSQTAEETKQQQSSKTLASFDRKDVTSSKNPSPSVSHQIHRVNLDTKDDCREKTIMFTADDEFMDMTRSHTVNIARGQMDNSSLEERNRETCGPLGSSANGLDLEFKNFLASLSQTSAPGGKENRPLNTTRSFGESCNGGAICLDNDVSRDTTEAQKGLTGSDDPFQCLFPTQDMYPHCGGLKSADMTSGQRNSGALGSSDHTGMGPSWKPSLKTKVQRQQVRYTDDEYREKTVRFSADDAGMDVTQCLTVNISSNLVSDSVLPLKKQEGETFSLPSNRSSSAHGLDPGLNNLLTSLSKASEPSVDPVMAAPTASQKSNIGDSSHSGTICPQDDVSMDMTEAQTNRILGADVSMDMTEAQTNRILGADVSMDMTEAQTGQILAIADTNDPSSCLLTTKDGHFKKAEMTSQDSTRGMESSLTASLKKKLQGNQVNFNGEGNYREKTVRFTASDAAMDMTRSHTVNITSGLDLQSQHVDVLPACGEKTVRFAASDAAMDMTRSHTVNIATDFKTQSQQNVDFLPTCGEKTVRFTIDDAAMDVTRSHTVNISANFETQSQQHVDVLPACGEKTVRFTTDDAAMDVTRSHTVNIATDFKTQSQQNVDFLPTCGEKTVRFTIDDAAMDVTRSHTVNIATDFNIYTSHENMDLPLSVKNIESETCCLRRTRSSSAHALDPGFKKSMSRMSGPCANPVETKAVAPATPCPQETVDTNDFLKQIKTQPDVDAEREDLGFVSTVLKKPTNKTMTDGPEDDVNMDMTAPKCSLLELQTCPYEPPEGLSSTQDLSSNSDYLKKTEVTSQQSREALVSSNSDDVEIPKRLDSLSSNKTDTWKDPESRSQTCSLSQKVESSPTAVDYEIETAPSRKSRRMSLADIHSKVRRLSHMINTAPDTIAMDSCTAPLPPLDKHDKDINLRDKTISLPVMEPQHETSLVNTEENTQAQCLMQEEQPFTATTPFNLKTKQLMSRLSVGGFRAKLPQRSKPDDPKKVNSVGETITVNVTNQLTNFDDDVSNIYDEELASCEDISEMLDTRSLQKATELVSWPQEFHMHEPLQEDAFEQDFMSAAYGKKRPLPADENDWEDEKRMKTSTEMATDEETGLQSHVVECNGHITTAPSMTAQTADYTNSSHTASIRCEATFESTFKQSLFESQLEDYASEVQRKLDDGTITVLEFFKLFNIDFVIHNPRQSVLPGRLSSDTDRTPMDLLKDRHINRPKQMVYETNVLNLTEKVEGLKERMRDLDKPLKMVNRPLWEEIRNSSEKELKSFGAKLKERNNLFRKTSKVQSHEMKEVLYSDLVQANLEEQQRLRGRIEEADQMIKSLDDCIHELETEIAAVEEKGFEDTPSLKSCQEEMQKGTEALAGNDRQISDLEVQTKQNSHQLNRLKAETRNLESHVNMLHMVNEWKFVENRDNCSVYTFLHETIHLQLLFERSNGNYADESEKKISHITFKFQLDEEKSWDHACLVHRLLSQYIEGGAAWVEKYPTDRHVPKLLHDVALVVSRCRLLGEELRLLKMWGGLRLDILNISCVDTEVHVVFSSLKKCSKFEVIFSVSLTNHLCVLQVQDFRNLIGSTTTQQIEDIVASIIPGKNLLTKIVKRIHSNLLC